VTRREIPFLPTSPVPLAAFGMAVSLAVGVMLARHTSHGVALLLAVIYTPLVFLNLPLALVTWTSVVFIQNLPYVSFGPTVALILIGVSYLGVASTQRDEIREVLNRHRRLFTTLFLFVAWTLLTALWATKPGLVGAEWWQWLVSAVMFLIIATTINTRSAVKLVVGAYVLGGVLSVVVAVFYGGLHSSATAVQTATSEEGRLSGGSGDPNYLAAGLVPAIVMATGLMYAVRSVVGRWAIVGAIGILGIGLAASESRGGLVAAVIALLAMTVFYRGARGQALVWVAMAASVMAIWFSTSPDAWSRVTSFNDAGNGRQDIWHVAWEISKDHPLAGVGLNNFRAVSPGYVRKPGALHYAALLADHPHVVHNVYLQLLVETGVIGLGLFLAFLIGCIRLALRAARRFEEAGDRQLATLSRATAVAIIGELAASFFISNGQDFRLWILLALTPVLVGVAGRSRKPELAR
jgi:O-antigen ligase